MQGAVSVIVQKPDLERTEMDNPVPVILSGQPHRLPAQGLAEIDPTTST